MPELRQALNISVIRETPVANDQLARDSKIIPLPSNIIERPTNILTSSEAAAALTKPASAVPITSTALRNDLALPGSVTVSPPIADPGPLPASVEQEGMGSKLIAWAKQNPLPAVVVGAAAVYLIYKLVKGK